MHGEKWNAYKVLVGKREGKRPLGRPRHRCEDIKMDLREIGWCDMDWIHMAEDRASCEHGNEPSGSIKCWKILVYLGDWWLLKKDSAPWS
jgi:hypothetical protein